MLNEHDVAFTYREYTKEPLSSEELTEVLAKLGKGAREVMRTRDANKLGVGAEATDAEIVALMADNPKLLQRPIGVLGERAVVGRPPEALLTLL